MLRVMWRDTLTHELMGIDEERGATITYGVVFDNRLGWNVYDQGSFHSEHQTFEEACVEVLRWGAISKEAQE